MLISSCGCHRTSLLRYWFQITNLKMHSTLMRHQWDSSTPTFRSVYHFSILPQSQVRQDYYRGRRLGDVTLYGRQTLADGDFEKTQNLLARRRPITNEERNERRRRSQSRRRERAPSKDEQTNAKIPTKPTDSSLARVSVLNYSRWCEAFMMILSLTTALLICVPLTLAPVAERENSGSAVGMNLFEGIEYELVPDLRRWGKFCPTCQYHKIRC